MLMHKWSISTWQTKLVEWTFSENLFSRSGLSHCPPVPPIGMERLIPWWQWGSTPSNMKSIMSGSFWMTCRGKSIHRVWSLSCLICQSQSCVPIKTMIGGHEDLRAADMSDQIPPPAASLPPPPPRSVCHGSCAPVLCWQQRGLAGDKGLSQHS